uniref:AdoMet activation domain-containing protein n=1 Tax=Gongylonema pulchrum TaxID=637853 RepID=A0A183DBA0_9BILA
LADRLSEAMAEYLHMEVRRKYWGYSRDEDMNASDMLSIKYTGIRPAPGYPTQPDHSEKATLWKLLDAEKLAGINVGLPNEEIVKIMKKL